MYALKWALTLSCPQNRSAAARCYMRAARSNDTRAQFNLGVCYQEGLGVEKDLHKAAKWYCRAVIAP